MPKIPTKFPVTACKHMLKMLGLEDGQEKRTELRISADAEPWWGTGVYKLVECDKGCPYGEEPFDSEEARKLMTHYQPPKKKRLPLDNLFYGQKYSLRTYAICQCADTCAKCGEYIRRRVRERLAHLLGTRHLVTPSVCECVPCTCEQTPFVYHRNECEVSIAYHKLEEKL